jgi:hypothetical protein
MFVPVSVKSDGTNQRIPVPEVLGVLCEGDRSTMLNYAIAQVHVF